MNQSRSGNVTFRATGSTYTVDAEIIPNSGTPMSGPGEAEREGIVGAVRIVADAESPVLTGSRESD